MDFVDEGFLFQGDFSGGSGEVFAGGEALFALAAEDAGFDGGVDGGDDDGILDGVLQGPLAGAFLPGFVDDEFNDGLAGFLAANSQVI